MENSDHEKITIVHVTSSLKIGGAEAVLYAVIEQLPQFNHRVIYFHGGPYIERLQRLGIATYKVRGLVSLYDPLFFIRFFRLVHRLQPDCIHSLLWSANVASRIVAKLLAIPIACGMHNSVDQDGFFRNKLDCLTLSLADVIIAASAVVTDSLHKQYGRWLPAQKVNVVANGIDCERIHSLARESNIKRFDLGLADSDFIIGSVGRFAPVKNYGLLLRSFSLVAQRNECAKLVLVGVGPEEQLLKRKADELNITDRVSFVVGQQAYGYYPLFDCFALTSDKEGGGPLALLEAMSFGLPSVVTNALSWHPVIQPEINGMLVEAGNVHMLAQSLEKLLHDVQLRIDLGCHARRTIESSFSADAMIERYKNIFKNTAMKNKKT